VILWEYKRIVFCFAAELKTGTDVLGEGSYDDQIL